MKIMTTRLFWIFCFVLVSSVLWADHFPPSDIAVGKPEHVLAGVDVYHGNIDRVIQRLGKPDHITTTRDADYPSGSGERSYEWYRNGVRLRVGTEFWTDEVSKRIHESEPIVVDVWGKGSGDFGGTGRSLPLGADLATIRKIYGSRFEKSPHSVVFQWKDETTLDIDFNKDGRIVHMQLFANVE